MPDTASPSPLPPLLRSFDDPLGRKIIELHVWAVGEGLRGTEVGPLFDGLCQRLVIAGVPLWRTFAGMRTLHPQWGGYAMPAHGGATVGSSGRPDSRAATGTSRICRRASSATFGAWRTNRTKRVGPCCVCAGGS